MEAIIDQHRTRKTSASYTHLQIPPDNRNKKITCTHMYVLHITPYILISYRTHTTSYNEFVLFSQSGANLQRDPCTHQPCSRHPGIEQNKKSYPTTKGTEKEKKRKEKKRKEKKKNKNNNNHHQTRYNIIHRRHPTPKTRAHPY